MKNFSVVISSLLLSGVLLWGCNASQTKDATAAGSTTVATTGCGGKLAYVNIDTLEARYELLKTKRQEFKTRQEEMESELQRSYSQMQTDANEVQKKAQANTLTQAEYDAAQKRLMQMQQSLETRKQSLTEQLMKEQEEFNKDLKTRLDAFLENYNKDKRFDFIFSYSGSGSAILFVNKQLDITRDVVDGMNAGSKDDGKKK